MKSITYLYNLQAVKGQIDALRQAVEEERRRKEEAEAEAQVRHILNHSFWVIVEEPL